MITGRINQGAVRARESSRGRGPDVIVIPARESAQCVVARAGVTRRETLVLQMRLALHVCNITHNIDTYNFGRDRGSNGSVACRPSPPGSFRIPIVKRAHRERSPWRGDGAAGTAVHRRCSVVVPSARAEVQSETYGRGASVRGANALRSREYTADAAFGPPRFANAECSKV